MKEIFKLFDEQEEKFRLYERKSSHPNWIVFKTIRRKIITIKGTFYYNLTRYKKKLPNGKYQTFTYYHNNFLLQHRNVKKYDNTLKEIFLLNDAMSNKRLTLIKNPPSRSLIHYWKKTDLNIKQAQENQLIGYQKEAKNHDKLFVEIDDAYINIQSKKQTKKLQNRMLTFNLIDELGNKIAINSVQILMINGSKTYDKYKNADSISKLIEQIKNKYYNKKINVIIKGDGAKIINKISNNFEGGILDKFHLIKSYRDFKTRSKRDINQLINFITPFKKTSIENDLWAFLKSLTNKENQAIFNSFWDYFKSNKTKLSLQIRQKLGAYLRYLKNNSNRIYHKYEPILSKSNTESYVNFDFKNLVSKRYTRWNIGSIKQKLLTFKALNKGIWIIV
ncbi:Mbov_0401 family ICE element transposase-like protein [Mycoplasma buteonis]|uniref:Mbov_0401 family ICE element transposase-like protein n=1 Tax=Mycoplasma buteonis TaxID=171280 RepID=UPI00055F197F|nr:hypothetical protein [Mycoplasma buteonis]